jgi:hypothetical protein
LVKIRPRRQTRRDAYQPVQHIAGSSTKFAGSSNSAFSAADPQACMATTRPKRPVAGVLWTRWASPARIDAEATSCGGEADQAIKCNNTSVLMMSIHCKMISILNINFNYAVLNIWLSDH